MTASDLVTSHRKIKLGSDRSFGLIFAVVFTLIALSPVMYGAPIRWWALIVAGIFTTIAVAVPRLLRPLNRVWFALGLLLHHAINPIIMAVMFYGTILPMALLLRALGKDLLRLKRDPKGSSYWIVREPPGPAPNSMPKQF